MKKIVLIFGLVAGLIVSGMMLWAAYRIHETGHLEGNEVLGFTIMAIAFSGIYVGIKNFRDKHNGGVISFGKAFKIGFYITLIASTMYVAVWLVDYYVFIPDFMEKYTACVMTNAKNDGATEAELAEKAAFMAKQTELYKNPLFVVLFTYMEIFPIGLIITLISALILKRKNKPVAQPA